MIDAHDPGDVVVACTIAATNYVPRVRVLARSFFRHHPDGRFFCLIVDDPIGAIGRGERFEVLSADDIGLPKREFREMALYYDVTELSTAVKPWVLRTLLSRTAAPVLYIDPDCWVLASLKPVARIPGDDRIALTPHLLHPMPRDGLLPDERHILQSGVFNLGFIGLGHGPNVDAFLTYWKERLQFDAVADPAQMLFTDQRWVDFVPGMFSHEIVRDPGCNVAYWNAHERDLRVVDGCYLVGDRPLRFFHFSGFNLTEPHLLSRHVPERPRLLLSEQPALRLICRQYLARVEEQDFDELSKVPYLWSTLANGIRIDAETRSVVRRALRDGPPCDRPPDLTAVDGVASFMDWLVAPNADGVPRVAGELLARRPDVRAAFPLPDGADAFRFASWLELSGSRECGLDPQLAHRLANAVISRSATSSVASITLPHIKDSIVHTAVEERSMGDRAVEVIGYVEAELGIGEAARRLIRSLAAADVRHRVTGYHEHTYSRLLAVPPDAGFAHDDDVDIVVSCVNADLFPHYAKSQARRLTGRYRIGYWFWELDEFPPDAQEAFDHVDEVWCATRFIAESVRRNSPVDVVQMPLAIEEPFVDGHLGRRELGLPGGFIFLFVFDFLSVFERKNPLGLIEAFSHAFRPQEGPTLVIKTINGEHRWRDFERLRHAAADRPDIVVWDGYLTACQLGSLMKAADCYVSLHRSEGLGLTLAEAMAVGVPVIGSAYGGNLEFMDEGNSTLVPTSLVRVGQGNGPYPSSASWAEPDFAAAVDALQGAVGDPGRHVERAARARVELLQRFDPRRVGEVMADRVAMIRTGSIPTKCVVG